MLGLKGEINKFQLQDAIVSHRNNPPPERCNYPLNQKLKRSHEEFRADFKKLKIKYYLLLSLSLQIISFEELLDKKLENRFKKAYLEV